MESGVHDWDCVSAKKDGIKKIDVGSIYNGCVCLSVAQILLLDNCKCYVSVTSGHVGHIG